MRIDEKRFFDYALVILSVAALIGFLGVGCGDDEEIAGTPNGPAWTGDPLTQTRSGPVMGVEGKGETWVWKAIPFAKPPVGSLRWKAPRDPDPWTDAREERDFCEPCAQYFFIGTETYGSEDCLYLNVWRPPTFGDESARLLLDTRRWKHPGHGVLRGLQRREPCRPLQPGGRDRKLPDRTVRVVHPSRPAGRGPGQRAGRFRQLRNPGPDQGPRVGAGQHRGIWRGPGKGDDRGGVCRGIQRLLPPGFPSGRGPVSQGHGRERRAHVEFGGRRGGERQGRDPADHGQRRDRGGHGGGRGASGRDDRSGDRGLSAGKDRPPDAQGLRAVVRRHVHHAERVPGRHGPVRGGIRNPRGRDLSEQGAHHPGKQQGRD